MKKIIFSFLVFIVFFYGTIAYNSKNVGENLYKILENNKSITKRVSVNWFCYIMSQYNDTNNQFDAKKSVFLRILCNETGVYNSNAFTFAKDIKLKDSIKKYYKNVGDDKRFSFIGFKCRINGINGKEGSLNNWDFACVAKDIFDKLENDIFNIVTLRILGGDISDNDSYLVYWEDNIFGDKICKGGYLDGDGDKNNVCRHSDTLKYLENNVSNLRENIISSSSIYDLKSYSIGGLYDFVGKYGYDPLSILLSLKNISYDELYFYNLFLAYYSEVVQKSYGTLQVVGVSDNPYDVFGKINYKEINEANSYINLSQAVVNKTWLTLTQLMWTYPIHIGFLAIQEDLKDFMQALAWIYTPLDQLRYKLINNQDLDRE